MGFYTSECQKYSFYVNFMAKYVPSFSSFKKIYLAIERTCKTLLAQFKFVTVRTESVSEYAFFM